jgi:hypothetical protein
MKTLNNHNRITHRVCYPSLKTVRFGKRNERFSGFSLVCADLKRFYPCCSGQYLRPSFYLRIHFWLSLSGFPFSTLLFFSLFSGLSHLPSSSCFSPVQ